MTPTPVPLRPIKTRPIINVGRIVRCGPVNCFESYFFLLTGGGTPVRIFVDISFKVSAVEFDQENLSTTQKTEMNTYFKILKIGKIKFSLPTLSKNHSKVKGRVKPHG